MANATKDKKQEIAETKVNLPANIDLESMAGAGMETVRASDMAIPFLKILQSLSPELKQSKNEYIEGAKEGLICNTVSKALHENVRVVPCVYNFVINEWKPNRGGYVATHQPGSASLEKAKTNGNDFVDTANWFVLIEENGKWTWGVIAMTMTALKHSRRLMTQLQNIRLQGQNGEFTPPLYTHILNLGTAIETKDNNEWMNWQIELQDTKTYEIDGLFQQAKAYYDAIQEGAVKAVPPQEPSEPEVY